MSEQETCPNCGSGDYQNLQSQRRACDECGTRWWVDMDFPPMIPRRSQPAEMLELPDSEGQWWYYRDDCEPAVVAVRFLDSAPAQPVFCMTHNPCPRGQYVRAVAPLVKPPVRDADLDLDYIRSLVGVLSDASNLSVNVPKAELDRLRRIADRLEAKGAKRE